MKQTNIPTHPLLDLSPLQFKIERINYVNRYDPLRAHRHEYFEIFLFEEGGGYHLIDFERIPILSSSIHFVTPGQVHEMNRAPTSCGFVLLFSPEFHHFNLETRDFLFLYPLFYSQTSNPTLDLPDDEFAHILKYVESMLNEFAGHNSKKKEILQSYLNIFLLRCKDWFERQMPQNGNRSPALALFQQFRIAVEKDFQICHNVAEYARKLLTTPRQLSGAVQKYAGVSAVEFIHNRVVLEAKRLLLFSGLSVGEIGFSLGFDEQAHFCKFIRKCTGQTPSRWRENGTA